VRAAPLTDTHVLVTGAGRGIGRALAIACCHGGAAVSLVARTAAQIDSVAQEIRDSGGTAYPYLFDVTSTDGIRDLIATVDVRHPSPVLCTLPEFRYDRTPSRSAKTTGAAFNR
jgi:NAD(P)-dependent dehydrogenase (short-subunit alcohol dehydrogenase family)